MSEARNALEGSSVSAEVVAKIRETFEALDVDGNGVISRDELPLAFLFLGWKSNTDALIKLLDTDGDGVISLAEFIAGYHKLKEMRRLEEEGVREARRRSLVAMTSHPLFKRNLEREAHELALQTMTPAELEVEKKEATYFGSARDLFSNLAAETAADEMTELRRAETEKIEREAAIKRGEAESVKLGFAVQRKDADEAWRVRVAVTAAAAADARAAEIEAAARVVEIATSDKDASGVSRVKEAVAVPVVAEASYMRRKGSLRKRVDLSEPEIVRSDRSDGAESTGASSIAGLARPDVLVGSVIAPKKSQPPQPGYSPRTAYRNVVRTPPNRPPGVATEAVPPVATLTKTVENFGAFTATSFVITEDVPAAVEAVGLAERSIVSESSDARSLVSSVKFHIVAAEEKQWMMDDSTYESCVSYVRRMRSSRTPLKFGRSTLVGNMQLMQAVVRDGEVVVSFSEAGSMASMSPLADSSGRVGSHFVRLQEIKEIPQAGGLVMLRRVSVAQEYLTMISSDQWTAFKSLARKVTRLVTASLAGSTPQATSLARRLKPQSYLLSTSSALIHRDSCEVDSLTSEQIMPTVAPARVARRRERPGRSHELAIQPISVFDLADTEVDEDGMLVSDARERYLGLAEHQAITAIAETGGSDHVQDAASIASTFITLEEPAAEIAAQACKGSFDSLELETDDSALARLEERNDATAEVNEAAALSGEREELVPMSPDVLRLPVRVQKVRQRNPLSRRRPQTTKQKSNRNTPARARVGTVRSMRARHTELTACQPKTLSLVPFPNSRERPKTSIVSSGRREPCDPVPHAGRAGRWLRSSSAVGASHVESLVSEDRIVYASSQAPTAASAVAEMPLARPEEALTGEIRGAVSQAMALTPSSTSLASGPGLATEEFEIDTGYSSLASISGDSRSNASGSPRSILSRPRLVEVTFKRPETASPHVARPIKNDIPARPAQSPTFTRLPHHSKATMIEKPTSDSLAKPTLRLARAADAAVTLSSDVEYLFVTADMVANIASQPMGHHGKIFTSHTNASRVLKKKVTEARSVPMGGQSTRSYHVTALDALSLLPDLHGKSTVIRPPLAPRSHVPPISHPVESFSDTTAEHGGTIQPGQIVLDHDITLDERRRSDSLSSLSGF